MPELAVFPLEQSQLGEAYPLVRAAARVTADQWESYAQRLLEEGGGILAVTAEDNRLHGLAAYRELDSLRHGPSLQVDVVIALELGGPGPVRQALCRALEDVARSQGCKSLSYALAARSNADPQSPGRISWEDLGLHMDTIGFVRELP